MCSDLLDERYVWAVNIWLEPLYILCLLLFKPPDSLSHTSDHSKHHTPFHDGGFFPSHIDLVSPSHYSTSSPWVKAEQQ